MSVDLLLAIAGIAVTVMVVAGMFLIMPGGVEAAPKHVADPVAPDPVVTPVLAAGGGPA
jgi:hypothetical protein